MGESQFGFLRDEFPDLFELAGKVETYALTDPGTSVIYARKCLELGVKWMYRHDRSLPQPYDNKLNTHLNTPAFKALADGHVFNAAKKIQLAGNRAVHESKAPSKLDAVEIASKLHVFCIYIAHTYGRVSKPDPRVKLVPQRLPAQLQPDAAPLAERKKLESRLDEQARLAEEARRHADEARATIEELEAERARLFEEVAAAKVAAQAADEPEVDWSEAETRRYKIDALLGEAGWQLDSSDDREYRVRGLPPDGGTGVVDYVLWGDDGLPLGLVEAKKAMASPLQGQQQAKAYADRLEAETGQRPVIYYSNGYEHYLWDDARGYPPRQVQGFATKDELRLLVQRRSLQVPLASVDIDKAIAGGEGRYYQERAIRTIAEEFEAKQRKALLVMATGTGKTRTVAALADLLMRANRVKRVLFLADRSALVNQTVNVFKSHLPDSAPVNLVTDPQEEGRVYVSTYQTMIGKIDEFGADGTRRFGPGYFDLVVIDEAHRSVYRKYRGIFEYFDCLLVGLTATPRTEVDKNTYGLFDLEPGVPTDVYELEDAVRDGVLVPPRGVSVPLAFMRHGIRYDDLAEDEKDEWDDIDWGEDEEGNDLDPPDVVQAEQLNKWLFNKDTVDKVLQHLMTEGIKVAGGDRLGKTIIFAKNQEHAEFIYKRFIAHYPHLDGGNFARIITNQVRFNQQLIDDFSIPAKAPHIAISVDMLDTGIDVPEIVNLVFFKLVRSKTKFWQMMGRGTRLRRDLFGPGDDKTHFNVFDFCQNLEFFSHDLDPADAAEVRPLSERIFGARLELIRVLDEIQAHRDERAEVAATLREAISSMNEDNFLVRPHLELVERFRQPEAWETITLGDLAALADRVAKLPTQLQPDIEDAKRFDILMLTIEQALLLGQPFEQDRRKVVAIASALEDQLGIPAIAAQLPLLEELQTDEWWVDVTYPMLETVRKKLRALVQHIRKTKRNPVYADFSDTIGDGAEVVLPGTGAGLGESAEFVQFRKKAGHFLKENLGEPPVVKVRSGEQLTVRDIAELQRLLVAADIGATDETFEEVTERVGDLGLFVRQLVGLDRAAAKQAFATFLDNKRYSSKQIEFVNLIINELTDRGVVEVARLFDSPYKDLSGGGPDDIFGTNDLGELFEILGQLANATTA